MPHLFQTLGLTIFALLAVFPAHAAAPGPNECYLSPNITQYNCNAAAVDGGATEALTSTSDYVAARSDPAIATFPVDITTYNLCRYVDNNSTNSYFIPFSTQAEWRAIVTDTNPPPGLGLVHCSRATAYTIYPGAHCSSPSPASITVNLPYARYYSNGPNATQTRTAKFECAFTQTITPQNWYETSTVTFTGLDSDVNNPSWLAGVPAYQGSLQ